MNGKKRLDRLQFKQQAARNNQIGPESHLDAPPPEVHRHSRLSSELQSPTGQFSGKAFLIYTLEQTGAQFFMNREDGSTTSLVIFSVS